MKSVAPQYPSNSKVVKELEKEASTPRNGTLKIPREKVKWIEYLLDKYGEDYEVHLVTPQSSDIKSLIFIFLY